LLDEVNQNFLLRIIKEDETCVYCYNAETKHQFCQW
jgi:hypothetical protein